MRNIALAQLRIARTDKYIFQRRDGKAPTSPYRLALFGGHIEEDEDPLAAIKRELGEETSLKIGGLVIRNVDTIEVPANRSSDKDIVYVHLFNTIIKTSEINFKVFEGSGSEIYTIPELLERNDIAATIRYIYEETLPNDNA